MPDTSDSDTPRANLRQPYNTKSEGGGERILVVMDRSDQADTKQRKLHHFACAPLQPSPPYPSKLAVDPMAQVEGIVCLDIYDDTDVQPLSSTSSLSSTGMMCVSMVAGFPGCHVP